MAQLSFSQEMARTQPDSLLLLLEQKTAPDSNRLNLLVKIGNWYKNKRDLPAAQSNFLEALKLAESLHASHQILRVIDDLSRTTLTEEEMLQLTEAYGQALSDLDQFSQEDLSNSINFAAMLTFHSMYSESLHLLFKLEQKIKGTPGEAQFLPWIWIYRGELFSYVEDFDQAKLCRKKGIKYAEAINDVDAIIYGRYTLGWALADQKHSEEALNYWQDFRKDTTLVKKGSKEYQHCNMRISECFFDLKQYDKAIRVLYHIFNFKATTKDSVFVYRELMKNYTAKDDFSNTKKVYDLSVELLDKHPELSSFVGFFKKLYAQSLIKEKRYIEAKELTYPILESLPSFPETKEEQQHYKDLLSIMIDANEHTGKYKNAFYYQKQLSTFKDSLQSKKASQRAMKMAAIHQETRNRAAVDLLSLKNKQQTRFLWLSIAFSFLFR